ncbi:MAG: dihydropteroate synthase [Verrucomicrobia bacterium]|nr:dihydropteroate synthase [Verrucomicrobiota bacterium]
MGVLNVTPDSFFDGGDFFDLEQATERALGMVSQGAGIIDIGGESTRPMAPIVPVDVELQRVIPVIERLVKLVGVPLSIDTQKPDVARRAIEAGASIVNDVGAASEDPAMLDVVAQSGCGYICMHMQGNPRTMQTSPTYSDVVSDVDAFFTSKLRVYRACGIDLEQVVLDVGIGFGKEVEHNLELLRHLESYKKHGRPILLGVSRKSFIGKVLEINDASERGPASLACVCWGLRAGVELFRVHDVSETSHVVRMWQAIESLS